MKSRTICCRWVRPCIGVPTLPELAFYRQESGSDARRAAILLPPFGEKVHVDVDMAGLALDRFPVVPIELGDEVIVHPFAQGLLVATIEELNTTLMARV